MPNVNGINKSVSQQHVKVFYLGAGDVVAISNDIKCISNKNTGANNFDKINVINTQNPLFKGCKNESKSSLYDSSSLESYRNIKIETYKSSEAKAINRGDEISEVKEIVERVNSGIEVFPSIHAFAQDIFEAKFKVEQLTGTSEVFPSPPESFIEPHEINPRNSIFIPEGYLFKLMTSLNDFCEKSSLSSDGKYSG